MDIREIQGLTVLRDIRVTAAVLAVGLLISYGPLFGEHMETIAETRTDAGIAAGAAESQTAPKAEWQSVEGRYFTVYYRPEANLRSIERKLKKRGYYTTWGRTLDDALNPEEKIAARMDMLLEKVKAILDMYPRTSKIAVRIFADREELNGEYLKIFKKSEDYRSFYVNKYKTIYTSEDDISDSVMAHEMGHAVVDHYFSIIPPAKISEVLASYVDVHLDED